MKKHSKEQEYIDNLEKRVRRLYVETRRNVEYRYRQHGEIDFMGLCPGGGWDIYEVKATLNHNTRKYGRKQLKRAAVHSQFIVNDMYLYSGTLDQLFYELSYDNGNNRFYKK